MPLCFGRFKCLSENIGINYYARAARARADRVAVRTERRLGGRGHTCLGALTSEYAPPSRPACCRYIVVNRDADERREQNTREPIVKRGSGSHPVASPRYFGRLGGAYSLVSAPRHVCPRPPSRRSVRTATRSARARRARVIVNPYVFRKALETPKT